MPTYDNYPAMDEDFNFPPEVRAKIAAASELTDKFVQAASGPLIISVVTVLPGSPDPNTLYFISET